MRRLYNRYYVNVGETKIKKSFDITNLTSITVIERPFFAQCLNHEKLSIATKDMPLNQETEAGYTQATN